MHRFRSRLPLVLAFIFTLVLACSSPVPSTPAGPSAAQVIEAYFSPHGGATESIVREIGNVKNPSVTKGNAELVKMCSLT